MGLTLQKTCWVSVARLAVSEKHILQIRLFFVILLKKQDKSQWF